MECDGAALLVLAMFAVASILLAVCYIHNMEQAPGYHATIVYGAPEYMF
jgi:hypothetical protein